jgi:hypothetical protein
MKQKAILDIPGYEGRYAITKDGQVWSHLTNRFLKPYPDGNGYLKVSLMGADGKRK